MLPHPSHYGVGVLSERRWPLVGLQRRRQRRRHRRWNDLNHDICGMDDHFTHFNHFEQYLEHFPSPSTRHSNKNLTYSQQPSSGKDPEAGGQGRQGRRGPGQRQSDEEASQTTTADLRRSRFVTVGIRFSSLAPPFTTNSTWRQYPAHGIRSGVWFNFKGGWLWKGTCCWHSFEPPAMNLRCSHSWKCQGMAGASHSI